MTSGVSAISSNLVWSIPRAVVNPVTIVALLALSYLPTASAMSADAWNVCMEACTKSLKHVGFWGVGGCAITCGAIALVAPGK